MSRTAKLFFGASMIVAVTSIGAVHLSQYQERQTMFAGVLRDDARLAAKKAARQAEFEEQARKHAYLESLQGATNTPDIVKEKKVEKLSEDEARSVDWGCKECER